MPEREVQLELLRRARVDGLDRRGTVVLIEGPLGTGKTTLLRCAADAAEEDGYLPLHAVCAEAERDLPLGALNQLAHALGFRPADTDDPGRTFQLMCSAVLERAVDQPVLIAIDDIHFIDEESAQWLLRLVRRSHGSRVLIVLSAEHGSVPAALRTELGRQPHFAHATAAPLTASGVEQQLRHRTDEVTAQRLGTQFLAQTGGNPLLLAAVIDDHVAGTAPQNHDLALLSCLYRGGRLMRELATALAALNGSAGPRELAELVEADPQCIRQALSDMDAAGLLDELRLRSAACVEAVLGEAVPAELAALRRKAAGLLHDRGADATAIAVQLVAAGAAETSWAQLALRDAAELAMLDGDADFAAECLRLAHDSCAEPLEQAAIRARLIEAEWRAQPATVLRHMAPLTAAAAAGHLPRGDHMMLVRQLLWHGKLDEAQQVLRQLRADAAEHPWSDELRDIESWLAYAHPSLARKRPTRKSERLPDSPSSEGADPWLHSAAVLADALIRGHSREAVERAQQVLHDVHSTRTTVWSEEATLFALMVLLHAEQTDTAAGWCNRLLTEQTGRTCTPTRHAVVAAVRAEVAIRSGDNEAALDYANRALRHLPPAAWGVAIGLPLSALVLANTRLGRFDEAARHLARPVGDALFHSRYGLHYLYARGHYYLATRHGHSALSDFLACRDLLRDWGLAHSGLVPWRIDAAEAWLQLDNRDEARRLVHDELAQAGTDQVRWRGLALRLLAEMSPLRRRPQLLGEALDLFERCNDRFDQARVLAALGRTHHALKDNRRARRMFRRAWHLAKSCGAGGLTDELASVVDHDVRAKPGTDGRAARLTDSENRVASLASMGYTNREIAERLFITASTVEQHLTRVFRKLGVKRRDDLPADLWNGEARSA